MNDKIRKELELMCVRLDELAESEREKADNLADYFNGKQTEKLEEIADTLEEASETIKEITED